MAFAAEPTLSTARDFDFWMGRWKVHNRRLRAPLTGSDEWDEFEATSVAHPILGGLGNEDEFRTRHAGGFVGMSFRFFDPATRRWSIYWADSRRPRRARPAGLRHVLRRHRRLRRRRRLRGPADQGPLHLVRHEDADAVLGAGLLRRRRRDLGDQLDHGLQPGWGSSSRDVASPSARIARR